MSGEIFTTKPGQVVSSLMPIPPPSFRLSLGGGEIVKITHDGHFFWKGVEVEGEQGVRDRLLELVDYFSGKKKMEVTP